MGEDYDPCMESRDALEKRLSEYVRRMRPEQKRKNALCKTMLQYVRERKTVPQADLLKTDFPGFIPEEVKCCLDDLVRKDRLVKTKLGSRWFVSLSDRELFRRDSRENAPGSSEK